MHTDHTIQPGLLSGELQLSPNGDAAANAAAPLSVMPTDAQQDARAVDEQPTLTRKEFWNRFEGATDEEREALHHEYYLQFVTNGVRQHVARVIGRERIEQSLDHWFNDIPLGEWDRMAPAIKGLINMRRKKEAEPCGEGRFMWSLSDAVCIAKAVAREMRNAAKG